MSGSSAVFVDQAIQHRFSVDSLHIGIDCRDAGNFALRAGNPLGDALMGPGSVVVNLVLDQDDAQMRLADDQHAVEELSAQGTDRRSQIAFMRGGRTAVRRILVPAAWKTARTRRRSSIRDRGPRT